MPIQLVDPSEGTHYERILIYGAPKTGKTRLATSLPDRFGPIFYVAEDDNSESLKPVLTEGIDRLTVIKSKPSYDGKYDPVAEAFDIALQWQKYAPKAQTLVWDTMSATGDKALSFIAEKGQFSSSQHIVVGAKDGPGRNVIPMQGDYGGAQSVVSRLTSFLMQLPLHVIVLCHEKYDEPQGGGSTEGGPATVGNATVRTYSKPFDVVIHLEKRTVTQPSGSRTVVTAYTERHGIWQASIRENRGSNPMPKVELAENPINFWQMYDKHFTEVSRVVV